MREQVRRKLVFHAGMVITLGMLSGIPLAMTALGYMESQVSDWTLSHMEGLVNGLLMLAVAAAGGLLYLTPKQGTALYGCILFTGYSNALYGWVRGVSGQAGMDFAAPISNQIAALLGGLPIVTAFIAIALLMLGASRHSQ